jgi:PatG Domain
MEESSTVSVPVATGIPGAAAAAGVIPQQDAGRCPSCSSGAASAQSYIYALGTIEWRYPSLSVEKEFAQAAGRSQTAGMTDGQVIHAVLSERENRYLARHLCWILSVQGLETYILYPRDPADLDLLIEATAVNTQPAISAVVGVMGPIANAETCNGLLLPMAGFDQIYTFSRTALISAIPRPEKVSAEDFEPVAQEVFDRIMQLTDNSGATDEHRALNYLALRYPAIYSLAAAKFNEDFSLTDVYTRSSEVSSTRNIVEVIFSHTNRKTGFTEKYSVRVDVTEKFPYLFTKISPYYDR